MHWLIYVVVLIASHFPSMGAETAELSSTTRTTILATPLNPEENSELQYQKQQLPKDATNNSMEYIKPELLRNSTVTYSMKNNTSLKFEAGFETVVSVTVTDIDTQTTDFLVVQAHSRSQYLIMSKNSSNTDPNFYVNSTDPGIVYFVSSNSTIVVYIINYSKCNISTLLMVRNYSRVEPIPGSGPGLYPVAKPYIIMQPNILTTKISFIPAGVKSDLLSNVNEDAPRNISHDDKSLHDASPTTSGYLSWASHFIPRTATITPQSVRDPSPPTSPAIKYEVYLSYMYEGDMTEKDYWSSLISMSTVEGVKKYGRKIAEHAPETPPVLFEEWLVSYSGVGAVVSVVASANESHGVLYSSAVSYGCDFIPEEAYNCTKLIDPLAKLFCASLVFIGVIVLFFGHRWLNFTIFISGFLASWFLLFVTFIHVPHAAVMALGWCSLFGAIAGGVGWLLTWHRFKRPFHSALLLITMNAFFTSMVFAHFLKFVLVPNRGTIWVFVVFPVVFAVLIIGYSIKDIKKVHIFSCTLLGSYACTVPVAFYTGSTLTYIVINVVSLMSVKDYARTIGYPPFQTCDIILLCLWIALFVIGMGYQLYRERSSPPFHPPSLATWEAYKRACLFVWHKVVACVTGRSEEDSVIVDEQPTLRSRLSSAWQSVKAALTCRGSDMEESGYQSFQGLISPVPPQEEAPRRRSLTERCKEGVSEWWGKVKLRLGRPSSEELLPDQAREDEELEDVPVTCCVFGRSRVVLDDESVAEDHSTPQTVLDEENRQADGS
ncbi:transmembrane 7 superfamily member 3-like [Oratosquilla oratoria]|uniref:transmembrane 7 superfamily member 3-like n=1 Tax=Oratosquilla oratoria TaxID=337810 RepID=UPI003F761996